MLPTSLGWGSNEIMEMPLLETKYTQKGYMNTSLRIIFPSCYKHIQDWYLLKVLFTITAFQVWPSCKYLSVFQIMYFSRCTFLLFQADLICSFPVHISNLSKVALFYVSSSLVSITPSYLPSSADIITIIGLQPLSKPLITVQNEMCLKLIDAVSSWNLQHASFHSCWIFQRVLRSLLWFREPPNWIQGCFVLFCFNHMGSRLVSHAYNKIK